MNPKKSHEVFWAKAGKNYLPIKILDEAEVKERIKSLQRTIFCHGCQMPVLTNFTRCETHRRDWCPACDAIVHRTGQCTTQILWENDCELSRPLIEARKLLRAECPNGQKKVVWLGENKVSNHRIANTVTFLPNLEKMTKKSNVPGKKTLFFNGVIAGLILAKQFTPRCQNEDMDCTLPHPPEIENPLKRIEVNLETKVVYIKNDDETPNFSPSELYRKSISRRNWARYKVKHARCECCPGRTECTTPCCGKRKRADEMDETKELRPFCSVCKTGHFDWTCSSQPETLTISSVSRPSSVNAEIQPATPISASPPSKLVTVNVSDSLDSNQSEAKSDGL